MSRSLKFLAASALTLVLASCSGMQTKKVEPAEPAAHMQHEHMKKGKKMMDKSAKKDHMKQESMKKDHMKKGDEMMKEKVEHKKATSKKEHVEDHVTKNVMNNVGHVTETTAGTASAVTKAADQLRKP